MIFSWNRNTGLGTVFDNRVVLHENGKPTLVMDDYAAPGDAKEMLGIHLT